LFSLDLPARGGQIWLTNSPPEKALNLAKTSAYANTNFTELYTSLTNITDALATNSAVGKLNATNGVGVGLSHTIQGMVADGATVNDSALSAAISAAADGTRLILDVPGTYVLDTVAITKNIALELGAGVVLKHKANSTGDMLRFTNVARFSIRGGIFDGNKANQNNDATNWFSSILYAGNMTNFSDVNISDVVFTNTVQSGFRSIGAPNGDDDDFQLPVPEWQRAWWNFEPDRVRGEFPNADTECPAGAFNQQLQVYPGRGAGDDGGGSGRDSCGGERFNRHAG
jgi:hypothetical protein